MAPRWSGNVSEFGKVPPKACRPAKCFRRATVQNPKRNLNRPPQRQTISQTQCQNPAAASLLRADTSFTRSRRCGTGSVEHRLLPRCTALATRNTSSGNANLGL